MTIKQRNTLLADMTDDVAELVLRDNYLQTQAISLVASKGLSLLDHSGTTDAHVRKNWPP